MTGDPAEEAGRRRQKRALESHARHGQVPDPVHVLRAHLAGTPPGVRVYQLARWSTVARLVSDAAEGGADDVTDLGPLPVQLTSSLPNLMVRIGVRRGSTWLSVTPGWERIAQAVADMERSLS